MAFFFVKEKRASAIKHLSPTPPLPPSPFPLSKSSNKVWGCCSSVVVVVVVVVLVVEGVAEEGFWREVKRRSLDW